LFYFDFLCEVCVVRGFDFACFAVTNLPVIELRDEPLLLLDLPKTPRSFLPWLSGPSTFFDTSIMIPDHCM
jgi:hypothetical protein